MDAALLRAFLLEHAFAPPPREPAPPAPPAAPAAPAAPGVEAAGEQWFAPVAPFGPADCPLCREPLGAPAPAPQLPLVTCRDCQTAYHEPCALELGRCAVLGCGRARPRERARAR
jgi:hypothetical protein